MKRIGIIGGIGPESTLVYYKHLISKYKQQSPDSTHPEFAMLNINMYDMGKLIMEARWDELVSFLLKKINVLEKTGITHIALAANTPHVIQEALISKLQTPLISIITETSKAVSRAGRKKVGLLGTKITLDSQVYTKEAQKMGIEIVHPTLEDQQYIHDKYFEELMYGKILPPTKSRLIEIVDGMKKTHKIDGLILGGTELSLILTQQDFEALQVFDSTEIHAQTMVDIMLSQQSPT